MEITPHRRSSVPIRRRARIPVRPHRLGEGVDRGATADGEEPALAVAVQRGRGRPGNAESPDQAPIVEFLTRAFAMSG
jgi:hypothetical protein